MNKGSILLESGPLTYRSLLGTASSLLTTLNNPLNVTLLTSQLLSAPAIWALPEGLRTCTRCLSVFHSAAQALIRHEQALEEKSADDDFTQLQFERTLPKDEWIKAVISGADNHSPRWRHLLVLGGLLLGFGLPSDENLSRTMRSTLESALVTALNLSLAEPNDEDELGQLSITFVLNHCFPSLADHERTQLDYDTLLPVLMRSTFHTDEGLRSGYFLGAIDLDVQPTTERTFQWGERTSSYHQVQTILASPLISSLGPLSRIIGHSVEQAKQHWLVIAALEDLEMFAKTLHLQWRQNKLSEVDASEEKTYLNTETCEVTTPQLWRLLRSALFGVVIILRSVVGRMLGDGALGNDEGEALCRTAALALRMLTRYAVAPDLATRALQTLRSLYFISTRTGALSFSQYTFVNLTAMDILATHPAPAKDFLRAIKRADVSTVPQHPLDRNLDLFFLNAAEHFTLVVPADTCEELFIAAAAPYLAAGGNNNLLPIFEAAHSVMLAVFSAPQNAELTARQLPFYVEALFKVFPDNLTARQFRLAFKTLLRLTSPPALLAASQPMLPATLLELLYGRAQYASAQPVFPHPNEAASEGDPLPPLSEQAVLTLTVADTLPQLSLDLLDEWLPLTAGMMHQIEHPAMREYCKEHFWHMLIGGEMDPDRSGVCHAWWSTGGGRDMVLFGPSQDSNDPHSMSGALPDGARETKL